MRGLAAAVCILLIVTAALAAPPDSLQIRPFKSSTSAVLRSMVVPGAGQLYTGNYYKAAIFFIAEASLGAGIIWNNDRMMAARKTAENYRVDYSNPQHLTLENQYRGWEYSYHNQRNRLIWWTVGTILLSMGDAYVNAQLYGLDVSPDISYNPGTARVTVSYKF
jgi:hypothetical protein